MRQEVPSVEDDPSFKYRTAQYHLEYDLSINNPNTDNVMTSPQITVLTPGLNSHANTWSNNLSNRSGRVEVQPNNTDEPIVNYTGSYIGFNRIIRPYVGGDVDYSKVAQEQPPVGHNLEPQDPVIINSIICNLNFGTTTNGFFLQKKMMVPLQSTDTKGPM